MPRGFVGCGKVEASPVDGVVRPAVNASRLVLPHGFRGSNVRFDDMVLGRQRCLITIEAVWLTAWLSKSSEVILLFMSNAALPMLFEGTFGAMDGKIRCPFAVVKAARAVPPIGSGCVFLGELRLFGKDIVLAVFGSTFVRLALDSFSSEKPYTPAKLW